MTAVAQQSTLVALSSTVPLVERSQPSPAVDDPEDIALRGLVDEVRTGNRTAARQFLETIGPAVRSVVRRVLGPGHAEEDDLLQDALLGLLRALPAYRGDCSVRHYARRIALWRILEDQKRRRTLKRRLLSQPEFDLAELNEDNYESAEQAALRARFRHSLQDLLAELPTAQAEAFALRHLLDYSVVDIATATGTSANTVRSRLRLAKAALRARITGSPRWSELDMRDA